MNYHELREAVKNGAIAGAVKTDCEKHRLFISESGELCRFKPRSSRRGYRINEFDLEHHARFTDGKPPRSVEENLRKQYRLIEKYKRMAGEASFANPFIRDCIALPDLDTWLKELVEANSWGTDKGRRPKTLYELRVTTGTALDGKVISLNRIAKKYPREIARLREAICNRSQVRLSQVPELSSRDTTSRSKPL